jgi:hypothetical protein
MTRRRYVPFDSKNVGLGGSLEASTKAREPSSEGGAGADNDSTKSIWQF